MADKIIAVAAGHEITEKEFNEFLTRIPAQQQQYVKTAEGRQQALIQYANYFLFEKLGEEKGYDTTEEFQEILAGARRDLLSQYALTQAVKDITASLEECRSYYEQNPSQFQTGGQAKAHHILTDTKEASLAALEEIKDGKSFEDVAKEKSTCPSSAKGGDLGSFGRGQMVKEFDEAVFNDPEIGQIMGPVKTQFGWHLIRVDELTPAGTAPFENVAEQIGQKLVQDKQNKVYMAERARLIEKFGLEFR
ncbi:MAG: peptidylprolyl isomerase [Eubacterium sp.]|nr:peptidylprolyl isomerase [Eubacterium sp.]